MGKRKLLDILSLSQIYNKRPSEILYVDDEYTAYCFDEACAIIVNRMKNKESPKFTVQYKSFKDLYKNVR